MANSNFPKFFLWIAGTLVIGALGNGVWEIVFKPSLYWLWNTLLDIATLGLTSLRDGIYEEIARGSYERISEHTYALFVGCLLGLLWGMLISTSFRTGKEEPATPRLLGLLRSKRIFILILIAISTFLLIQSARDFYINRAANHIEQLQRVVAPYISADQRIAYASRVARIHTRQQYVDIMTELTEVAKNNNTYIPTFNVY